MSIPYMGSKRKSAGKIYQTIKNLNPNANRLCDLFCGGFAISEYFIKNGWNVIANDKNKYIIALLNQTIKKGLNEKKCLEFVEREKFSDIMTYPDKYDEWYVGYVMCIWSFGNSQKAYLFGKDKELYKKAGHELVINKNPELIRKLIPDFPEKYLQGILKQDNWHKRRIALRKVSGIMQTRVLELERLEQLERLQQLQQLQQLEQLEQLQQLQQLQRLELLPQLELLVGDYYNVVTPENSVIYCDPPYEGTAEYKEDSFNHSKFWDWVREKSKTHKVYISEYKAPDDFESVLEFEQNSTLSAITNTTASVEKLFRIKK